MALLMYGVFRGDKAVHSVSWLAVGAILITAIAISGQSDSGQVAFKGQFIVDQFSVFMKWLILLGSALAVLMSLNYNEREGIQRFEYPVLILFRDAGYAVDGLGQ